MTDNTNPSRRNAGASSSTLNIGIGMLIGLIVALIVAYFAMSGGPFQDKAKNNALTPNTGNTDPNAPLYTNQQTTTAPPTTPSNDPAANEQGAGVGVLTGGSAPSTTAKPSTVHSSNDLDTLGQTPSKPKNSDDPIGDLISNKTKPKTDSTSTTPNEAPKPAPTPKPAPKTTPSTDTPKSVTPVTAPSTLNKTGQYTIQAGSFSDEQNAQKLKKQLASQGQNATITQKKTSDGTVYRVRVGSYASSKDAQAANQKIRGVVLDMTP